MLRGGVASAGEGPAQSPATEWRGQQKNKY